MKHRTLAVSLSLAACLNMSAGVFAQTAPPAQTSPGPTMPATPVPVMQPSPAAGMTSTPAPNVSPPPGSETPAAPTILLSPVPGAPVIPAEVPGDRGQGVRRLISQQNNSGELGTVTLFGMPNNKTRVVLNLKGAKPGTMQPAHIHRGRDCGALDPKPVYPLTTVMTSESGGTSTTVVNAPIEKLLSGNYSVNVHASTANVARYVACGNLYLH